MKLLTKEIISKFEKHPFHSQDGKGMDAEVLVKYFNPCGTGTWLITEAEREGDDWRLFGYCHIHEWEWGYLMLSELAYLRLPFGLVLNASVLNLSSSSSVKIVTVSLTGRFSFPCPAMKFDRLIISTFVIGFLGICSCWYSTLKYSPSMVYTFLTVV